MPEPDAISAVEVQSVRCVSIVVPPKHHFHRAHHYNNMTTEPISAKTLCPTIHTEVTTDDPETIRQRCLSTIRAPQADLLARGLALSQLNSPVLIRPYGSFGQLLRRELKMSRAQAHRVIQYAKIVAKIQDVTGSTVALPSMTEARYLRANWADDLYGVVWLTCIQGAGDGARLPFLRELRKVPEWARPAKKRATLQWPPRRVLRLLDALCAWFREQSELQPQAQALAEVRGKLVGRDTLQNHED